jgi:hypothetical protein
LQDFLALEMRRYSITAIPDSNLYSTAAARNLSIATEGRPDVGISDTRPELDKICH